MTFRSGLVSVPWAWGGLGGILLLSAVALRQVSGRFAYEAPFEQMPIVGLITCYIMVAGLVTMNLPWLIRATNARQVTSVLILILVVGFAARLSQLGASTVLEDDYYRYLWDGAVLSIGHSPFAHAPLDLIEGPVDDPALRGLVDEGADVLSRINYPEYRTIYPPALQGVFAASHAIAPFSLDGWRVVLLGFELGIVALIWILLIRLGQSPLWLAVYWWNPVVIKEIANSAHMEPVLMLPVLAALYAIVKKRAVLATAALAVGAGIKLWPAILAASLLRAGWVAPRLLILCTAVMALLLAVQSWPILAAGLDDSSGFVAFGKQWRASSAIILVAQEVVALLPGPISVEGFAPRLLLGLVLLAALVVICARHAETPEETLRQMFLITTAIYLLSPSTTPWYFLWVAPFLCLFPVRGLMLAGVTLPLHYLYFHLSLIDRTDLYRAIVVWIIWVPVWTVLLWDAWHALRQRRARFRVAL